MNFFEAQDRARRTSRRLVIVYFVATALIVLGVTAIVGFALYSAQFGSGRPAAGGDFYAENGALLAGVAVLTTVFILGASLYKTAALSSGGGRVATQLGGVPVPADIGDPLRRRLVNVVEEMAIASGVPVPDIYVLEQESSINAFAAGYTPGDAAIAVTRGALELLDRDELQGVIAHEFSHVLNGDMRLNIRLMGVLFGILVLGLIGRMIVRGGHHTSIVSSRRDRSAPVIIIIGLGLAVLGGIGVFFARLIKAGVSRQREMLADSSAVQFTRQTAGIANALKKIGGYSEHSYIKAADPEEVSHMLFGTGAKLSGLFATHPPLVDRIRALDPGFDPADYPDADALARQRRAVGFELSARVSGITSALAAGGAVVLPEAIVDTVGRPEVEHVDFAGQLRQNIPAELYDAAHSPELAYLLTLALILDRSGRLRDRQIAILSERLGDERGRMIRRYCEALSETGAEFRLPLLEVSFPALKRRPAPQLAHLVSLTQRLIELDSRIDLYEYCFYRILMSSLGQAVDPRGRRAPRRAPRRGLRQAAVELLTLVAEHGHDEEDVRQAAFRAGAELLGDWAVSMTAEADTGHSVETLDASLDLLLALNGKSRRRLLEAVTAVAAHDGRLEIAEAELIRAVCATLDCPLPPILVRQFESAPSEASDDSGTEAVV